MKTSTKVFLIVSATVSVLGVGSLVKIAHAYQASNPGATTPQDLTSSMKMTQVKTIVEAGNGEREVNDDSAKEQEELTKLKALAKISPQQAQQAAEVALGGKASQVKLENEDGNLIYVVKIGQKEAKVDAGNSRVLYTETEGQEDKANEASHPRSSIQVSQAGDDGDGETNDDS